MRVAGMKQASVVDGQGVRSVLFMQGCMHRCEGCHNPSTHNINGGTEMSIADVVEGLTKDIGKIDGVTISGGDPFAQIEELLELLEALKSKGVNTWVYTGFTVDCIVGFWGKDVLKNIDVLIDGRFEIQNKCYKTPFRGSKNQRAIDCQLLNKTDCGVDDIRHCLLY